MRRTLLIGLIALAALVTGCNRVPEEVPVSTNEGGDGPVASRLATLPAFEGHTLGWAAQKLVPEDVGLNVHSPSMVVTAAVDATRAAGASVPATVTSYALPAKTVSFDILQWTHQPPELDKKITAQSPPAGTPMSQVSSVTVTAGRHRMDVGQPGGTGHAKAIRSLGAEPCFECHREDSCSSCHVALLD